MSKLRNKWLALTAGAFLLATLPVAAQEAQETPLHQEPEEAQETAEAEPAEGQGFTFTVDPVSFGILESDVDTDSSKWQE